MRTKALVGLAVLAVSAATCVAQNVYSLNIVGYVNKTVAANKFYLIENPLTKANSGGNNVTNVIPSLPDVFDGALIYTYDNGALNIVATYVPLLGGWSVDVPAAADLPPGKGFYLYTGQAGAGTITFVGEVVLSSTNVLTGGAKYSLVGSPYPAAMSLNALGLTGQDGDIVFRYDTTANTLKATTYVGPLQAWSDDFGSPPEGPTLNVGEAIFYYNVNTAFTWKQSFTVGP